MNDVNEAHTAVPLWLKHRAIEVAGWVLVVAGVAALVLPGPGLLALVAGLALLASRYTWAKNLLEPVRARAFQLASDGVQTFPRIASSVLGGLVLIGLGIVWGVGTPEPGWWPVADRWWLPGGWGTGTTLIVSGALALGMIIYSFHRYHGHPLLAVDSTKPMPVSTPRRAL